MGGMQAPVVAGDHSEGTQLQADHKHMHAVARSHMQPAWILSRLLQIFFGHASAQRKVRVSRATTSHRLLTRDSASLRADACPTKFVIQAFCPAHPVNEKLMLQSFSCFESVFESMAESCGYQKEDI